MKGQISRDLYRPEQRYSGVFHIQGGMVTDADLDERSRIVQARTDLLGDDTIKDGVPAVGGAVAIGPANALSLGEGVIYADGVRGVLAANEGADLTDPLALFTQQADIPLGPVLPQDGDAVIYADIWERPVFALEDPYLADAGLHGAETAFRTRTMTQLKAAPLAAAPDIEAGTGDFPRIGTALLAVEPLSPEDIIDECDPCADVVTIEQAVSNALWRLEIVGVEGTPTAPLKVALAWSIENAAAIAPADVNHEDFERASKVYQFFSPITESYAGVFADWNDARGSAFVDDLATAPNPPTDHDGAGWRFVRRWDGFATADLATPAIEAQLGAGFAIATDGSAVTLSVDAFKVTLDLAGQAVVVGDYWLVELRRFAEEADRIRLVSATPVGIEHHYCVLLRIDDEGVVLPPTDAELRKLSFPTLANLPADHVGFVNNCPKLYDDADNVQEALDNLCGIAADDIAFDPNTCPVLYNGATNVQDALANLCKINFSIDGVLRLLSDWGVVCGIVPTLLTVGDSVVSISAGSFLDRAGHLTSFEGGQFDLDTLPAANILANKETFKDALLKGEICLALAAEEGGKVAVFLVDKADAFGPPDPGFFTNVETCVATKEELKFSDHYAALAEGDQKTAGKMIQVVSNSTSFYATAKLSAQEEQQARAFNDNMFAAFEKIANEDETAALKARWIEIEEKIPIEDGQEETRDVRRMQRESLKLATLLESDEERMRRCVCAALFPTCPPDLGKPPFLVPIACLHGEGGIGDIQLTEICPYCCRKQAMTWRTVEYFVGEWRAMYAETLEKECCGPGEKSAPETGIRPDFRYKPEFYAQPHWADFALDYKLVESVVGSGPKPVTDYKTTIPVNDLTIAEATRALTGNGIEILQEIDIDDEAAFDKINEGSFDVSAPERLIDKGDIRPGDKVALLVQNGVVRDYALLERGSGKYLFPTEQAPIRDVTPADLERAEKLVEDANAARAELDQMEELRRNLSKDVETLKIELDTLTTAKTETEAAVAKASEELKRLAEAEQKTTERIAAATKEITEAERNNERIVRLLRGNQSSLVLTSDNPDLATRLAAAGIATVADVAALTPAQIRSLNQRNVLTTAEANALKASAETFIQRPIG